jgi:restriction system protein
MGDGTQGALYGIGSAMSLFQVKNYADEFLGALASKPAAPSPAVKDETVGLVAEEIEQTTRDFVLKRLDRELKGHPFAEFVAHLLGTMGYRSRVSPPGPDGGIDIIAHMDELGFEPPHHQGPGQEHAGRHRRPGRVGALRQGGRRRVRTAGDAGTFTPAAKNFAAGKSNLRLIDGEELVNLVLAHYEQFDSRYKGLLPLKRVYIPQLIEEND